MMKLSVWLPLMVCCFIAPIKDSFSTPSKQRPTSAPSKQRPTSRKSSPVKNPRHRKVPSNPYASPIPDYSAILKKLRNPKRNPKANVRPRAKAKAQPRARRPEARLGVRKPKARPKVRIPTSVSEVRHYEVPQKQTKQTFIPIKRKPLTAKLLKKIRHIVKQFQRVIRQKPKTIELPCEPRCTYQPRVVWKVKLPEVGESSPKAADLNADGILDIVVGSGIFSIGGGPRCYVYAVDGRTGKLLWKRQFTGDVYATAAFLSVNKDKVPDVVVAGRFANVYALDGRNGKILWDLKKSNPNIKIPKANFNTSIRVADIDNDGHPDLFTVQAGEVTTQGITIGRLYQISGRTGKIIKVTQTPDKQETYATPAYLKTATGSSVYVGTGGERIPGHMIAFDFPSMRERWRFKTTSKGFIASPLLYQFPGKSYHDVIDAAFDGRLFRLDGKTGKKVWMYHIPGHETYTSPAMGRFAVPTRQDVIATYYKGVWPQYTSAQIFWVNGTNGMLIKKRPFGTFSLSSPLVTDLNGDKLDEVIISTNYVDQAMMAELEKYTNMLRPHMSEFLKDRTKRPSFLPQKMPTYQTPYFTMTNTLVIFDGKTHKIRWSHRFPRYSSSTPLLQDLDHNGKLDLIYIYLDHMVRLQFQRQTPSTSLHWNQFRGPLGDGIYRP